MGRHREEALKWKKKTILEFKKFPAKHSFLDLEVGNESCNRTKHYINYLNKHSLKISLLKQRSMIFYPRWNESTHFLYLLQGVIEEEYWIKYSLWVLCVHFLSKCTWQPWRGMSQPNTGSFKTVYWNQIEHTKMKIEAIFLYSAQDTGSLYVIVEFSQLFYTPKPQNQHGYVLVVLKNQFLR